MRSAALVQGVVLIATLAWGAAYIHRTSFVIDDVRVFSLWDDAMISMTYARNFANGEGPVWNVGEDPVQGFSNPGVTLVMSLLHLLPISEEKISLAFQLLNLALLAAIVALGARLYARWFADEPPGTSACAALAIALCAPVAVWTLQGSDVGFATIWLIGCLLWFARDDPRAARALPFGVAAGVLIRPDLALFAVAILLASALRPGGDRRPLARGAVLVAIALGSLLLFGWLYYGDPIPNTAHLKMTGSPRSEVLASGFLHLWQRLPTLALALPLAAFAAVRTARSEVGPRLALLLVLLAFAYNTWVGGDWLRHYESRFVAPTLPLLLLLAVRGLSLALRRIAPERLSFALLVASTLVVAIVSNPKQARRDWFDPTATPMYRDHNERHARYGAFLAAHTTQDTTIGVYWGGVPPYFSRRRAVDVLGKSDRHIAKQPALHFRPGHSKSDWDYVLGTRKPDVFLHATDPLKNHPLFRRDYYSVRNAELAFYLRKDSLAKLDVDWIVLEDLETGERFERTRGSGR